MALRTTTLLAVALLIVGCENDPYAPGRDGTPAAANRDTDQAPGSTQLVDDQETPAAKTSAAPPKKTSEAPQKTPDASASDAALAATETFLNEAVSGGLMEIELGRMAESKARNERVKAFGRMMVKDHQEVNQALLDAAGQIDAKVVQKMNAKHQGQVQALTALSGAEFDREYMNLMVSDHVAAIAKFEGQTKAAVAEPVRKAAERILPALREHLKQARDIVAALESAPETPDDPAEPNNA